MQFRQIDLDCKVKRREAQLCHESLVQSWLMSNGKLGKVFGLRQMKSLLIQPCAVLMNFFISFQELRSYSNCSNLSKYFSAREPSGQGQMKKRRTKVQ